MLLYRASLQHQPAAGVLWHSQNVKVLIRGLPLSRKILKTICSSKKSNEQIVVRRNTGFQIHGMAKHRVTLVFCTENYILGQNLIYTPE